MESKNSKKIIGIALFGVALVVIIILIGGGRSATKQTASVTEPRAPVAQFQIEDLVLGTGAPARAGTAVTVHYDGWLTNGTKFDSSRDRAVPFQFPLDAGHVIPCWDQGLLDKKVGAKIKLTCPPEFAYGVSGVGGTIPPNATLVFEVEILNVEGVPPGPPREQ